MVKLFFLLLKRDMLLRNLTTYFIPEACYILIKIVLDIKLSLYCLLRDKYIMYLILVVCTI